jgi:hypothetical protein
VISGRIDMSHGVEIVQSYGDSAPPAALLRTIERLLSSLPQHYLLGLRAVVLSGNSTLNRSRRRGTTLSRGRKARIAESAGCYHNARDGQAAWIELFPDNILGGVPRLLRRTEFLLDILIGSTLFHELGHHLHATQSPEHREREDVAHTWRRRLMRLHFEHRYWYLNAVVMSLRWLRVGRLIRRFAKWRSPGAAKARAT